MRITLRIPEELGVKVAAQAKENCRSLNSQIVITLQAAVEIRDRIQATIEANHQNIVNSGTVDVTAGQAAQPDTRPTLKPKVKPEVSKDGPRPNEVRRNPPGGSKWSVQGWRYYLDRFGAEPSEAEWEFYQKNRM